MEARVAACEWRAGSAGGRTLPQIFCQVHVFSRRSQSWPDAIKWRIDLRFTVAHNLWEGKLDWVGSYYV